MPAVIVAPNSRQLVISSMSTQRPTSHSAAQVKTERVQIRMKPATGSRAYRKAVPDSEAAEAVAIIRRTSSVLSR